MVTEAHDVVISGAGPIGFACAIALAKAGMKVAVLDIQSAAEMTNPSDDGREMALTHASIGYLRELGMWDALRPNEVSRIRKALLSNGDDHERVLSVDGSAVGRTALGASVSNPALRRVGYEVAARTEGIRLLPGATLSWIERQRRQVKMLVSPAGQWLESAATPSALQAKLVVAADGRFSSTRCQLGVSARKQDHGRTLIVCRVSHERAHQEVAREYFGYPHTLGVLPLQGRASALVLTTDSAEAERLMALPEAAFCAWVECQSGQKLGAMKLISQRFAQPLVGVYAERFAGSRYALVGDAAVGMSPVTAHGFNRGLKGVQRLTQALAQAHAQGQDIGSYAQLASYHRQHHSEMAWIYRGTNLLARVVAGQSLPNRLLRCTLMAGARCLPSVQQAIRHQMMGGVPALTH